MEKFWFSNFTLIEQIHLYTRNKKKSWWKGSLIKLIKSSCHKLWGDFKMIKVEREKKDC